MSRDSQQPLTLAWTTVGAFVVGALLIAVAVITGNLPTALVGAAVVVATLIAYIVLSRRDAVAPVSFDGEFPANTPGPRGTRNGRSAPPIATNPNTKS